jgi:hypothetical protein
MGMLMKRIRDKVGGVTITKECCQDSVKGRFSGPQMADFYGYCLAATGRWLTNPQETENRITDQSFQIETLSLQAKYEASGLTGDKFLKREYPQILDNPITKGVYQLTPQKLYNEIIYKDATPLTLGYMMIVVGEEPGLHKPSHALGVCIRDTYYYFFDANEGFCSMQNRDTFWNFIYWYVTEQKVNDRGTGGLFAQGYTHFQVVLYNHQP